MTSARRHPTPRDRRARAPAFTLVEMLVTVAAFSLVAVGLAVIFEGVGRTVTAGRRVSDLTATAAAIERQMREDFSAMTREGFLVIAHAHANDGSPVPAYPQQPPAKQRSRRCDEIVFFAEGDFRSARDPLAPGHLPSAREARIYYGHGRRLRDGDPSYRRPQIDDDNLDSQAGLGEQVPGNPNRYPSQWTLLRHVTVLAGPPGALRSYPSPFGSPTGPNNEARESDVQVALQPAVSSLFRSASRLEPCAGVPTTLREVEGLNGAVRPRFASGVVDVATTSLEEIRAWVLRGSVRQATRNNNNTPNFPDDDFWEVDYNLPASISNCNGLPNFGAFPDLPPAAAAVQHAWMLDAFPAPSQDHEVTAMGTVVVPGPSPLPSSTSVPDSDRTRLRFEPEPTDYFAALAEPDEQVAQMRLADQKMLTASNFLPRCSEFIVEWSFGDVYFNPNNTNDPRNGQAIWHGKRREVPSGAGNPALVADLYLEDSAWNGRDAFALPYRLREPWVDPATRERKTLLEHPVSRALIHGVNADVQNPPVRRIQYSTFGYADPTFNPADPDPGIDGEHAAAAALPWAWPELIRVTLTLADATDPSVEQTFQFVFRVPGNPPP